MTQAAAVHVFLGLLWAQLALALAPSWQDGTYYSYGWLVLGACVLFYQMRRRDLPPPLPAPSRPAIATATLIIFLAAVVLLTVALRLIQGANPFWRLLLWTQGLSTLLATAALLAFTDGFRASRHYLPALLLILIAIPLPSVLETSLVQSLTSSVVLVSSDLARSCGVPLEVADTAFIIRGHPLDVNDRCSGIRSFQSSLAVALIVGELLRLIPPFRLLLLLAGALASFVGNTFRVLSLVLAFFDGGFEGLEARHDTAGMASVTLTYGFILLIGILLDRWSPVSGTRIAMRPARKEPGKAGTLPPIGESHPPNPLS